MSAPSRRTGSNGAVVALCLGIVAAMGGLAYASVPLYELFCRVTGYGGTTQVAETASGVPVLDRTMTVRFDANVASGLPWRFAPDQPSVTVRLGEVRQVGYHIVNDTDRTLRGTAVFNVSPQDMGSYFNKLQCFCFTETVVKPGERLDMPVVFFIDPAMDGVPELKGHATVTLSYTFYAEGEDGTPVTQGRAEPRPAG